MRRTFFDAFARRSPDFSAQFRAGWEQLVEEDPILPLDALLEQMPKMLVDGEVHFSVALLPLDGSYLVVVTDVTSKVAGERAERERLEVLELVERVLADRGSVREFFEEGNELIASIFSGDSSDMAALKRRIHTLKGNAGIFGLESVAGLCHDLETHISEEGAAPRAVVERLAARWSRVVEVLERIMGDRNDIIELDVREHEALEAEALRAAAELAERVRSLKLEPTRKRFRRLAEHAHAIGERLGKAVEVVTEGGDERVDPHRWGPFWRSLVHAVRNAVDHGIEAPEERVEAGKPTRGKIVLRSRMAGDRFVIEIVDDGRGIDWERVRARAKAAGFAAETDADLHDALFRDSISTANEVSEISGRGVGMGALLEATRELDGDIRMSSRPGQGTTARISFPSSSMAAFPRTSERRLSAFPRVANG
ncbi:MAG: ATP-binding protein [Rubrivivax sp.]